MSLRVDEIRPTELAKRIADGDNEFILLDCRKPEELLIAALPGATHIPMDEIPARIGELDAEREIIVFCRTGRRSYSVAMWLMNQGFENVTNLTGGIDEWSQTVDPSVPRY